MKQYNALAEHFDKIADFQHLGAICGWDEAAMMPAGGGESRARALARLQVLIHDLVTDDQVPGLLLDAAGESLNAWQQANLREINRAVVSASAVPSAIVEQLGLATARCEQAWRIHRANNDWSAMQPLLQTVVDISRERAAILAN